MLNMVVHIETTGLLVFTSTGGDCIGSDDVVLVSVGVTGKSVDSRGNVMSLTAIC